MLGLLIIFIIVFTFAFISYVVDVFLEERQSLIEKRLDLILSLVVPFYLWFLIIRNKWRSLK